MHQLLSRNIRPDFKLNAFVILERRPSIKIIYALISIILLFVISCTGQSKKPYPTLVLNDKYNQIQKENSKIIPQNYKLESRQGLILDCSNYDFSLIKKMNENILPDQVHIISKAGTFTIKLNINAQTILDNSTMQSLDEKNKPFTGFIKGDTAILAIGTIKNNEMMTYWLGMIEIK